MTLIGVLMLMVTGPTPMTDGRGSPTKISGGPLTIMGAGLAWPIRAGSGFRATIWTGDQHGFPGEQVATMSVGRRFLRVVLELFMRDNRLALVKTSISIPVPTT